MQKKSKLVVVPGLSSPYLSKTWPAYQLLREEGNSRGFDVCILDFVGCGHYSERKKAREFGRGFSIPAAARKIEKDLQSAPGGSILFCRSSGCNLAALYLVNDPGVLRHFAKIIFWGASGAEAMWGIMPECDDPLEKLNRKWKRNGMIFDPSFWKSYVPLEVQCSRFRGNREVILGVGARDEYTTVKYQRLLRMLINRHTKCRARIIEVPDACHSVTPDTITSRGLKAYSHLIFS